MEHTAGKAANPPKMVKDNQGIPQSSSPVGDSIIGGMEHTAGKAANQKTCA